MKTYLQSSVGDWPAYLAALNGHLDVLKLLYQLEGALWWRHEATGNTLIHAAASGGHLEIIRFLLNELNSKKIDSGILDISMFYFTIITLLDWAIMVWLFRYT